MTRLGRTSPPLASLSPWRRAQECGRHATRARDPPAALAPIYAAARHAARPPCAHPTGSCRAGYRGSGSDEAVRARPHSASRGVHARWRLQRSRARPHLPGICRDVWARLVIHMGGGVLGRPQESAEEGMLLRQAPSWKGCPRRWSTAPR
eukprot:1758268-Prymnesium_polylepis.2